MILEVVEGQEAGRQVKLDDVVEIGRDPTLRLSVDDGQLSRRHARIRPDGESAVVEDLGSTNGTYVNDQPLQGPRALVPGDRIRMGLTVLELRSEQQVSAQPSAVRAVPEVTALGQGVLQEVPEAELSPVEGTGAPVLHVDESEPAFVPREFAEGEDGASADYQALARLVDPAVKHQTTVAAFALLSIAGLACLIFFGTR